MTSAKLPRPQRHALGELAEVRDAPASRAGNALGRQERLAHVDDRHREPERPGQLRDGRRVVSGAEDHEVGRRQRDFVEQLRAADALGT